jgi:broad specificity phosphatase PhoE
MKYPDTKVPGGEEAQTFLDRWGSQLRRLLRYAEEHPQEPIAAVVHGHQFMALRPILERDDVRERDWDNLEKMPPGTLLRLAIRDGEVKIERVRT